MNKIQKTDHLYLIDGSGYIFRAYYALPPLTRKSDGLPTGAVSGFCSMLFKLLEDSKSKENKQFKRSPAPMSRKAKFQSILLDKNFEPENPKSLEDLTEETCKWPIGHPNEEKFYFCGRKPEGEFPYCKLHVLYAFQPKNQKEDDLGDEIPEFIEKKVKSAG